MWVRGLKLTCRLMPRKLNAVAPYVGAWIETNVHGYLIIFAWSHPMWVRGLKPQPEFDGLGYEMSHPMWVRGLKHKSITRKTNYYYLSRTLCGCVD